MADRRRVIERAAGALSIAAGVAHGGLTPAHAAEWWGYGLFFLAAAISQTILGLALLLDALEARYRRALYLAGTIGTLLILAMYVVSRTLGVPFAGPAAGNVEPLDALGIMTALAELGVVVLLLARLPAREPHARQDKPSG